MSEVTRIQIGIDRVRRFRHSIRTGSAWSAFSSVLILGLLAAMGLDILTDMGKLERSITLALLVALAVWAIRKFIAPILGIKETDIEIARMIERRHGLETDFVAALQFSDGSRAQFGSNELRDAAIQRASKLGSGLNYLTGFSRDELTKRMITLAICAVAFIAIAVDFPDHTKAFFNRLFLGNAHYPTDTRIVEIVTPGDYAPFGLPLEFQIKAEGVLPESGYITLKTRTTGLATTIELVPSPDNPAHYQGLLERAAEDFTYQVYLGDAYTHPRHVKLTPLPVVEVNFEVEIPPYAQSAFAEIQAMHRGIVALEGSRVIPRVTADKPLEEANITVADEVIALEKDSEAFTLKGSAHPLQFVTETVRWSVQVKDHEGLGLAQPMAGILQVRPDQPPTIGIATSTRLIWAGAEPTIRYKALDDYGLDQIHAFVALQRWQDGNAEPPAERKIEVAIAENHAPELDGEYALNLSSMNLQKGDRLYVSFAVTDYRGDLLGQTTRSEPIILEVSDREGVIAALRDLDAELERKLDQIINAQLGIGEAP